jgi:S-adenosylmethionine:tRNA ribosyltransferase-isomerase
MEPGSVQIPSAGRAFTLKLLFDLKRMDIDVAHIVLHTRLSSYMYEELDGKHPGSEEEYFINKIVAEKIDSTHRWD